MNHYKDRGLLPFVIIIFFMLACVISAQQTYNLEIIFHTECPLDSAETFGMALSSAGDVNNDGYDDIIIGSRAVIWAGAQDTSPGHAYIYYGGSLIDTIVDISLPGEHPLDLFGLSVCGLGDINCDSIDDVAVGAPNCAQIDSCGRVYIYFGGSLMDSMPDMILKGTWCGGFGCAIARGDINGDGWSDIIVGECGPGRVNIYYGGPLLDTIPDIVLSGIYSFGRTVGSGGDVNNDGFDDIVIGADENSEAYPGAGKVYVYFGGNPMDTIPDCWLHGEGVNQYLGWTGVDMLKNVTQYSRILTGTPFWPNGFPASSPGKIYVMDGNATMDTLVDWYLTGETDSSSLGTWSSSAGNCDNNLFNDILSGAPAITDIHIGGAGFSWLAGSNIDTTVDAWLSNDNIFYYLIGFRIASADDVNGDGYDEVMFSNCAADSNQTVWVCRYTGQNIEEEKAQGIRQGMNLEVYPNPFSRYLTIRFQVHPHLFPPPSRGRIEEGGISSQISLMIFDVTGRLIKVFNHLTIQPFNEINWDGADAIDKIVPAGVYFVQVQSEGNKEVQKVIKLK